MIHKNVALIETIEGGGTGILYPCKIRRDNFNKIKQWENSWQYVLVLTNAHVLNTIGLGEEDKERDFKSQIILHMYDNMEKEIPQSGIQKILVYNSGSALEGKDDIAALLVALDGTVSLTLEEKIESRLLNNREEIFMEGYPGVLYEDDVSGRLQLQGIEKKIFPVNEEVGAYQITDDYHWYNGMKDRQLLMGLSGSPVYWMQGEEAYILGMAQSVSDIQRGENPFKLMYYIRFPYILKHLREADCIIYRRKDEYAWELEWIYGQKGKVEKREISLLLLGGSGSGKSSLAKSLAYHGSELYSTSDGQTTRTKVFYNYSITCSEPRAEVKFLLQAEFRDLMMEKIGQRPALFLMQNLLGLDERSVKDEMEFLENCYKLLERIGVETENESNILMDIRSVKDGKMNNRTALECYEEILDLFWKKVSFPNVKYLLDNYYLNEIRKVYREWEKRKQTKENLWKYITEHDNMLFCNVLDLEYLETYCQSDKDHEEKVFAQFQQKTIDKISEQRREEKGALIYNDKSNFYHVIDQEFLKQYQDILLFCEGYFDIQEFKSSFPDNSKEDDIRKMILGALKTGKEAQGSEGQVVNILFKIDEFVEEEEEQEIVPGNRKTGRRRILQFCTGMKRYYEAVHRVLKEQLQERYHVSGNPFQTTFDLNNMDQEKRKMLQQCLQTTPHGSLTGLVNYIWIQDMVSDVYAWTLQELRIWKLQLVDTCGLDHVEVKNKNMLKRILYENRYYYDGKKLVNMQDISVIYLKKLDSGRPDELRTVLPCVREVFPASPVYCLFTGIDIYYRTPEEIAAIHWKQGNEKVPKAVNYILSGKFQKDCAIDENMYIVMRNNLVPFCGKRKLVKNCFQVYKNNTTYMRMLLASITMMEYSSLEIVDWEILKKTLDKIREQAGDYDKEQLGEKGRELVTATENLMRDIFRKASLRNYAFRYNTKQADILSFCRRNRMGYSGTYFHQLNQRFHEGYAKAVLESGMKLAEVFTPKESAVMAAMKNMEHLFLGEGGNLVEVKFEKKNEFRKILEEMFAADCYSKNPLIYKWENEELKEGRNEIFDDIFNFRKGLEEPKILKGFVVYYLKCLKKQIRHDNRIKSENMLKLNKNFIGILESLKEEYMEKYRTEGIEAEEMERRFKELMRYYFSH